VKRHSQSESSSRGGETQERRGQKEGGVKESLVCYPKARGGDGGDRQAGSRWNPTSRERAGQKEGAARAEEIAYWYFLRKDRPFPVSTAEGSPWDINLQT